MSLLRHAFVLAAALSATLLLAPSAQAEYDHLECYKVKEAGTFKKAQADLEALRAEYGIAQGCLIKPHAKILCTPVAKTITSIEGGTDTPFASEALTSDRLCYKIKCPAAPPAAALYSDQLGSRTIEFVKSYMLCTPAVAGPPPTTTLPACVDGDSDGFGTNCVAGDDCDDTNAQVHPGATEICNAIDDDCNGATDDSVTAPGDCATQGVCQARTIPEICLGASGWKCNYSTVPDAQLTPMGDLSPVESGPFCGDGKDNNCNGIVDDGCPP